MNPPAFTFPLETITVPIGDYRWQIRCLRSRDMFLASNHTQQSNLYGFVLWESSIALAEWLAEHDNPAQGKRVLELGAGVGLPGFVAQNMGGDVTQTDYQVDSLDLCRWNGEANGIKTEVFQADWRHWSHASRYDLILGADILYEEALHYYVERIFHRNLAPGGRLLLADPGRPQALAFAVHLEEHGWQVAIHTHHVIPQISGDPNPLTPSHDGAVAVTVYEAWRG